MAYDPFWQEDPRQQRGLFFSNAGLLNQGRGGGGVPMGMSSETTGDVLEQAPQNPMDQAMMMAMMYKGGGALKDKVIGPSWDWGKKQLGQQAVDVNKIAHATSPPPTPSLFSTPMSKANINQGHTLDQLKAAKQGGAGNTSMLFRADPAGLQSAKGYEASVNRSRFSPTDTYEPRNLDNLTGSKSWDDVARGSIEPNPNPASLPGPSVNTRAYAPPNPANIQDANLRGSSNYNFASPQNPNEFMGPWEEPFAGGEGVDWMKQPFEGYELDAFGGLNTPEISDLARGIGSSGSPHIIGTPSQTANWGGMFPSGATGAVDAAGIFTPSAATIEASGGLLGTQSGLGSLGAEGMFKGGGGGELLASNAPKGAGSAMGALGSAAGVGLNIYDMTQQGVTPGNVMGLGGSALLGANALGFGLANAWNPLGWALLAGSVAGSLFDWW